MINVNKNKLARLIAESIEGTADGYWESEEVTIGIVQGMEITFKVSKEVNSDEVAPHHLCITDTEPGEDTGLGEDE
jgi:hypothetical protein